MKKGTLSLILGLLLVAGALGLTGYNLWDDHRAEKTSTEALSVLAPQIAQDPIPASGRSVYTHEAVSEDRTGDIAPDEIEYPSYVLDPTRDMPVKEVDGRTYVGVLDIPSLGRSFPVQSEWSYSHLKATPCRYAGSVYLDTMVICAHNYAGHFSTIKNLRIGDTVTFTDIDGNVFNYRVLELITLRPNQHEDMVSGDDWDLTLFTCTVGGRSRIAVRCERVEEGI